MTLSGGGSRARKKTRRMPSTPAEVERARNALLLTLPWGRKTIDETSGRTTGSFQVGDRTYTYPLKVRGPIQKGCNCVYFVAESAGPARTSPGDRSAGVPMHLRPLPPRLAETPYEATSLCQGGRIWTGHRQYATKAEADRDIALRARIQRESCKKR